MNSKRVNEAQVMQLATAAMSTGQPWVCTVYFVVYGGCFYWLSYPERRHSQELADNPKAAITIAIKQDLPVIGLQAEGDVAVVNGIPEATQVLARYVAKYGSGQKYIELLKHGSNHHKLYKLTPTRVMLFDETQKEQPAYREIKLDD
jgi:uncharacterized protein YhbP (UPF0306 family)